VVVRITVDAHNAGLAWTASASLYENAGYTWQWPCERRLNVFAADSRERWVEGLRWVGWPPAVDRQGPASLSHLDETLDCPLTERHETPALHANTRFKLLPRCRDTLA
jgi:hypothetical protein